MQLSKVSKRIPCPTVFSCLLVLVVCLSGAAARGQAQKSVEANLERGRQLLEEGRLIEASEVLEKVLKEQPDNKSAREMLITCYRFTGIEYYGQSDCSHAVAVWKKALALDHENQEIKKFILRCESENQAIARIAGDSASIDTESSSLPSPIVTEEAKKTEPEPRTRIKVVTDTLIISRCHRTIRLGVSSGAARVAGTVGEPRRGFTGAGTISVIPAGSHFGLRLEGTYSRFYQNGDDTSATRHMSVAGLNLEGVLATSLSNSISVDYSAGVGVFEVISNIASASQVALETHQLTTTGVTLGLGLRKRLGSVAAVLEGKYTHLSDSGSPDLVRVSLGLSTY